MLSADRPYWKKYTAEVISLWKSITWYPLWFRGTAAAIKGVQTLKEHHCKPYKSRYVCRKNLRLSVNDISSFSYFPVEFLSILVYIDLTYEICPRCARVQLLRSLGLLGGTLRGEMGFRSRGPENTSQWFLQGFYLMNQTLRLASRYYLYSVSS